MAGSFAAREVTCVQPKTWDTWFDFFRDRWTWNILPTLGVPGARLAVIFFNCGLFQSQAKVIGSLRWEFLLGREGFWGAALLGARKWLRGACWSFALKTRFCLEPPARAAATTHLGAQERVVAHPAASCKVASLAWIEIVPTHPSFSFTWMISQLPFSCLPCVSSSCRRGSSQKTWITNS
jgi:hypothetical protein